MKKTALITGASRGIGKAIALEIADIGYNIAIVGRDSEALAVTASEAASKGVEVFPIEADLADVSSIDGVVEGCVGRFGGIDVLVNCAGLSHKGEFTEVTPEEWDKIFAVNAKAPFFLCKAALPYLKASPKSCLPRKGTACGV